MNNQANTICTIPKIIHYCWFGNNQKPESIQQCIDSWKLLPDYKIIEWNENNCTFDENDYVNKCYINKKWAFVADYYRLKALYEYGGIYLDTDVKVYRSFDTLLHHPMFLNFIYDCSIGTAVIGCIPNHPIIGALLDMYEHTVFSVTKSGRQLEKDGNTYIVKGYVPNNYYFTYYILKNYPNFILNNKYQDLTDLVIYPKELFEIGTLFNKHYTIHYCTGTWKTNQQSCFKRRLKNILHTFPKLHELIQICVRKLRYYRKKKFIPFYEYSIAQKKHNPLPPI